MKSPSARRFSSMPHYRRLHLGLFAVLLASTMFAANICAQAPGDPATSERPSETSHHAAEPASPAPNYALESRFLPDNVNKLVFDLGVTPHWFSLSDRFWYSYRTSEGTKYYIVDPVKKSRTLLWDNAKVAAALSALTNFPYDAQHLPVKRLKLVEKDTRMRFEVEIRKNAVVPNEPEKEKKDQEDATQQGNESEMKQTEQQGQQGQRAQQSGRAAEPPEETRILFFEYDLANGKVTRLDNFEAPGKKPLWASVSPSSAAVVDLLWALVVNPEFQYIR